MSISRFQEVIFGKSGCGYFILFGSALVFALSLFYSCGRSAATQPNASDSAQAGVIGRVGELPITARSVEDAINAATDRASQFQATPAGAPPPPLPLSLQATIAAQALRQIVDSVGVTYLAQRAGIQFVPSEIEPVVRDVIQRLAEQTRQALIAQKKVPANATDAQIDAVLRKEGQPTLAQQAQRIRTRVDELIKEKQYAPLAAPMLVSKIKAGIRATDAEVRAANATYEVKRIVIAPTSGPGRPPAERAEEALTAIRKGTSFEQAMAKYSTAPTPRGKSAADQTVTIPAQLAPTIPGFEELPGKPVGYVSDVESTPEGAMIYKVVGIKENLPKDFAARADFYRRQYVETKATQILQRQLEQLATSGAFKWTSPGYKALWDYGTAASSPPGQREAKMRQVIQEAKAVLQKGQGLDSRAATFAWFAAFDALWNAPGADRSALADQRIEVLNAVLQNAEDYQLRMELVDLYAEKKNGAAALAQLVGAARANNTYDLQGESRFRDIAAKAEQLVSKGLVKAADLAELRAEQARWRQTKADADKAAAEVKRQQEEQRRQSQAPAGAQPAPGKPDDRANRLLPQGGG